MLKKLRKKLQQQQMDRFCLLAAVLGAAVVFSGTPVAAMTVVTTSGHMYGLDNTDNIIDEFINLGTINSNGSICFVNNGNGVITTLTNNGNIISSDGNGVTNEGNGVITTLINNGTINGVQSGIFATSSNAIGTIINNGTISSAQNAIFASSGTIGKIINTGTISGDVNCIYVCDNGSVDVVSESGGKLYGPTYVSSISGGTLNLTLNNAIWTTTDDSSLTSLTMNGGVVKVAASSGYHNITARNLSGSGSFYLNSNLSAGLSDSITINGSASGNYHLAISNSGDRVSSFKAVKVVAIASGANNTATFTGGGDNGAYCYEIGKGSALSTYFSGLNSDDYYYYNAGTPSNTSKAAMAENAGTIVAWYGELNEIKKRLGDLRMGVQSSDDLWTRVYGDKYNVQPGGQTSYSQIMHGIEIGKDNMQAYKDSKKYTGFLLGFGKANNTYSDGGSGTTNSDYVGAYTSWLKDDGAYIDLIGKYNWMRHDFTTPILGGVNTDGGLFRNQAMGLSMEIGKHINRTNGIFIEPQAELASLWSNQATYTTNQGLLVDVPSVWSLQLRLGCQLGKKWSDKDGTNRQFYGKVSWVNEYAGDSKTIVDNADFDSSLKGHQWVTGLGYVEDGKHHQVYLDAEKSWGNTTSKVWGVNAGYRWKI
jgi:outer membrane autotransporter protein